MKINCLPPEQVHGGLAGYLRKLKCLDSRRAQLTYIANRKSALEASHNGNRPNHLPFDSTIDSLWQAELPDWMKDQRNQMTGPADNAELVVKLLNSNSPGVMLDLEDSMANDWPELKAGILNIQDALHGELTYIKRGEEVGIKESNTVIFSRVRGLHMTQYVPGLGNIPAPLFDLASITYGLNKEKLKHPLCIYIPKTELATEALWWKHTFETIEKVNGWDTGWIKAMALVESHPLAYQMEEFSYLLQPYLVGLNLGRWDYMASLIDYNFNNPDFLFPDRNSVPSDIPFFQNLRHRMAFVCHKHGMLAIGGMSALFPDRKNKAFNMVAQRKLKADKENEAACLMDGAWTGHPDQNDIAVNAFPYPNQIDKLPDTNIIECYRPDLREFPRDGLCLTDEGTKDAIRTSIRYRHGVLNGKGAVLLDGYMEDLATDRIYRVMVSQRLYNTNMDLDYLDGLFSSVMAELGPEYNEAAEITRTMIIKKEFNPV